MIAASEPSASVHAQARPSHRPVRALPAVLAVAAAVALLWAGPVASASAGRGQSAAQTSPSPAPVKYYIVPSAAAGSQSLSQIAATTLHDADRFMVIFRLNKGRLQPDGGRLENPDVIHPGWILRLPANASGPGVHFGPLPGSTQPAVASASPGPARRSAAGGRASVVSGADLAGLIVVTVTVTAAVLAVGRWIRRRPRAASGHRSGNRRPGRRASRNSASRVPASEVAATGSRIKDADLGWLHSVGGSDWPPGWDEPLPELHPDHPSASFPKVGTSAGIWVPPATPDHDGPAPPDGGGASRGGRAGFAAEARVGSAHPQTVLTRPRLTAGNAVARPGTRDEGSLKFAQHEAAELTDQTPWDAAGLSSTDALKLASRVLAEASEQASYVTLRARDEADGVRAAALQEAIEIKQLATDLAAAIIAEAERDAAQTRAAVMTMSAELGQVAAYVTENLFSPARPAVQPQPRPASQPALKPAGQPATKRPLKPESEPAKPAVPRQYGAMRVLAGVVVAMLVLAVTAGATEVGLHGFRFFVFRAAGTGATPSGGLKEDQGPGQRHAPKPGVHSLPAHQHPRPSKSSAPARGSNG